MLNWLFSSIKRYFERPRTVPPRIGVFCHIYYPELAEEMFAHLSNIPGQVDVLISTDSTVKAGSISAVFGHWTQGQVRIEVVPNRGRDIGPRMTFYRRAHYRYDLILYVHTKRGNLVVDGEQWRQYLLHNLVGSRAIVDMTLAAFRDDPPLGMVFPRHWPPVAPFIGWGGNVETASVLVKRLNLPGLTDEPIDFPSGSMFWCRAAALRPLLDLKFKIDDFEPELGQTDATLAHAIERMFLVSCRRAGYRWRNLDDEPERVAMTVSSVFNPASEGVARPARS